MANFLTAFEKLIDLEGGYVNDPNDSGGETKYGISKRAYPKIDIKNLTIDEAKKIYKSDYWDKLNLDDEESQEYAKEVFNFGVHAGIRRAKILRDRVDKRYSLDNYMLLQFKLLSAKFYVALANKDKRKRVYLLGWFNRIFK